MSTEGTFCLVKDFPVYRKGGDVYVKGKEINRCEHSEDMDKSSFQHSLQNYIQELREADKCVLYFRHDYGNRLKIQLPEELDIDRLCSILPKPFLRIQCKRKTPSTNTERIMLEKRLKLRKILQNSQMKKWLKLFAVGPKIESYTVDITLGWVEKAAKPGKNSIKLNSETFMQNLFAMDSTKDLTIVASRGAEVRCHRLIFEVHSDVLSAMISPNNNGIQESRNARFEMLENSEEGLSHLIRYLYGMELSMDDLPCGVTIELFKTAHKYKMAEILEWLGGIFLRKESRWFTPDDLLELYFYVKNLAEFKAIEKDVLRAILSQSKEIRACDRLKELKRTDSEAAFELLSLLLDMMETERRESFTDYN